MAIACIIAATKMYATKRGRRTSTIYITKIYDRLNNLDEIVDVTNVKITNQAGGLYSDEALSLKEYISADGRILYAPDNVIYELKYPNLDIKGTIR